jgi:steroid delta-isomerase-like uncharacterized protein
VTDDETRSLVRRFYEVLWNSWDDDAVQDVLADTFRFRGSLGAETSGCAGWREYRDMVRSASPNFHNEVVELVCENGLAAARLACTGHHLGNLLGIPPTGRPFHYSAAAFFECADDHITNGWVLGDVEELRSQLSGT